MVITASGSDLAVSGDEGADASDLGQRADYVSKRLALLANGKRLRILCHLAKLEADAGGSAGEATVTELQHAVGLGQSALSQHLARLRHAGTVATRREAQNIRYRLADDETRALMHALYSIFCAEDDRPAA